MMRYTTLLFFILLPLQAALAQTMPSPAVIAPARPALADERLLVPVPPGFKVAYQTVLGKMVMQEFIPGDETIDDWKEMVTVEMFQGDKAVDADAFAETMRQHWASACKDTAMDPSVKGMENGYADARWSMRCPNSPKSGKPEFTWFKAIQGNDNFYVVQKTFKFEPSPSQVTIWNGYLDKVSICDMRGTDHPCPDRIKNEPSNRS